MQRKIIYAGVTNTSFVAGSEDLANLAEADIPAKQVERLTKGIGLERCDERDRAAAAYLALPLVQRKAAPPGVTPPELAVVGTDGGRLQILDRTGRGSTDAEAAAPTPPAPTEAPAGAVLCADTQPTPTKAEEALEDENPGRRGRYWREDKVGLLMAMTSAVSVSDPCPDVPEGFLDPTRRGKLVRELRKGVPLADEPAKPAEDPEAVGEVLQAAEPVWQPPTVEHKRLVASRRPWQEFGPLVATAAWEMGLFASPRQAFLGDGAETNWTVWRSYFGSFVPILDFIHALSYVYAAAHAGRGKSEGWCCYRRWIQWTWQGEVAEVLRELVSRQAELGPAAAGDKDSNPRVVVDKALTYLRNNETRMRYDQFRRQGLPIVSSYVESAVKQFNQRVKGTEKFWGEEGAEAILQLRADHLSDNQPLEAFWERRQAQQTGQRPYFYCRGLVQLGARIPCREPGGGVSPGTAVPGQGAGPGSALGRQCGVGAGPDLACRAEHRRRLVARPLSPGTRRVPLRRPPPGRVVPAVGPVVVNPRLFLSLQCLVQLAHDPCQRQAAQRQYPAKRLP
jgi:hypothetical protein